MANGRRTHGGISKLPFAGAQGAEKEFGGQAPIRETPQEVTREPGKETVLHDACDCQREWPRGLAVDSFGPIGTQHKLESNWQDAGQEMQLPIGG